MASQLVAYLLWLCGGIFGLHHVYLRRDAHAFLWWTTCGLAGLGWVRDAWRIPVYVAEVNEDPLHMGILTTKMRHEDVPSLFHSYGVTRLLGQILFGFWYYCVFKQAALVLCTDPEHGLPALGVPVPALAPEVAGSLGMAAGIWLAGSTARHIQSNPLSLLSGCLLGLSIHGPLGQLLIGTFFMYWSRSWVRTPIRPRGLLRRLLLLALGAAAHLAAWALIFFFLEVTATSVDGSGRAAPHKVRVRDAIIRAYHSRVWEQAWSEVRGAYDRRGWDGLLGLLDVTGERHARRVLGVAKDAPLREIKAAFRRRAREWHPDLNPDPTAKARMEELNSAHQLLTKLLQDPS